MTAIQPLAGVDGVAGSYIMALGEVVGVYVDEKILKDGRVDAQHFPLLARLGYMDYSSVEQVFSLQRPTLG